jgi:hypothetical protein
VALGEAAASLASGSRLHREAHTGIHQRGTEKGRKWCRIRRSRQNSERATSKRCVDASPDVFAPDSPSLHAFFCGVVGVILCLISLSLLSLSPSLSPHLSLPISLSLSPPLSHVTAGEDGPCFRAHPLQGQHNMRTRERSEVWSKTHRGHIECQAGSLCRQKAHGQVQAHGT